MWKSSHLHNAWIVILVVRILFVFLSYSKRIDFFYIHILLYFVSHLSFNFDFWQIGKSFSIHCFFSSFDLISELNWIDLCSGETFITCYPVTGFVIFRIDTLCVFVRFFFFYFFHLFSFLFTKKTQICYCFIRQKVKNQYKNRWKLQVSCGYKPICMSVYDIIWTAVHWNGYESFGILI